jgi:hypothetical protein
MPAMRTKVETQSPYFNASDQKTGSSKREEMEMSILSSIGRIAAEFSAARVRHQTERSVRSLPIELQKDIGWPDAFDSDTGYRRGVGSWAGNK